MCKRYWANGDWLKAWSYVLPQTSCHLFLFTCIWMATEGSKGPTHIHWALCYKTEKCEAFLHFIHKKYFSTTELLHPWCVYERYDEFGLDRNGNGFECVYPLCPHPGYCHSINFSCICPRQDIVWIYFLKLIINSICIEIIKFNT